MKIGIYNPYLDTVSGGEKYMLKAALCLSSKHNVSVFWDPSSFINIKNKSMEKFGYDLSPITFVPNIFSKDVSLANRFFSSNKYDKILYLSDGSIPVVNTKLYIHFQFPVEWVKGGSIKNRLKIGRVSKVICNSFFTKSYIDREFAIDSVVVYPPVDVSASNGADKENIILNVGRFGQTIEGENFKKQDVMIDTFKKMVDSGLRLWRLVLVIGYKEEEKDKIEELKKLAEGYPIEIVDNPPLATTKNFFDKSKIYWHATGFGEDLIKFPEKAEHFGISTVEAMAHRCVPVVINAGGQKEIVQEGKNGFLWNTKEELIEKTIDLMKNPDALVDIGEKASLSVSRFGESRFCEDLEKAMDIV